MRMRRWHIGVLVLWGCAAGAVGVLPSVCWGEERPSTGAPRTESQPNLPAEDIERWMNVLGMPWHQKQDRGPELEQAVQGLARLGDDGVALVMAEYDRPSRSAAFRHRAIQVLGAAGTDQAQGVLLDIAFGKRDPDGQGSEWAAATYLRTLSDQSGARPLLESSDPGIRNIALLALKGVALDRGLLDQVHDAALSENPSVRAAAADVLKHAPGTQHSEEKLTTLLEAIRGVDDLPYAHKPLSRSCLSQGEDLYRRYIGAIAGADLAAGVLAGVTTSTESVTHTCVVIARGMRGDPDVRTSLLRLAGDPEAGMFRAFAVRALGYVGTGEDLAFLREVAESDPLVRKDASCASRGQGERFLVREAAEAAITMIDARRSGLESSGAVDRP